MKKVNLAAVALLTLGFGSIGFAEGIGLDIDFEKIQIERDGGDINKIPVREEPGRDAEIVLQEVHSKNITVLRSDVTFKWTTLGYGAMTHKVLVPQLAAHTLFNHRNPGEDGPCLRSDSRRFGGVDLPVLFPDVDLPFPKNPVAEEVAPADPHEEITIAIKISNRYSMNREKSICKIQMVEDVRTVIGDEEFYHTYTKDMGFRYIADCPEAE